MRKKGISPLIATVLIIGFTVALAAVIMTWGQSFIKGMQERTAESTQSGLTCAQEVKVDVQNACLDCPDTTPKDGICDSTPAGIKVTTANDGTIKIDTYSIRVYESSSKVATKSITTSIDAFGITTEPLVSATPATFIFTPANVKAVEVVPTISIEGVATTCTASADKFGNEAGTTLLKAC